MQGGGIGEEITRGCGIHGHSVMARPMSHMLPSAPPVTPLPSRQVMLPRAREGVDGWTSNVRSADESRALISPPSPLFPPCHAQEQPPCEKCGRVYLVCGLWVKVPPPVTLVVPWCQPLSDTSKGAAYTLGVNSSCQPRGVEGGEDAGIHSGGNQQQPAARCREWGGRGPTRRGYTAVHRRTPGSIIKGQSRIIPP